MATDAAFYELLESDLRALSAEARKTDSLATQITGWLQHTDFPQIKESAERAVLKLRAVAHEGRGVEAVRTPDILRPFLLVCESKNPRLISIVLGSIQTLLAHNAVSDEGRTQIVQALQQVEKNSDDTVKLKILQTALTLLQNPRSVDDKDGTGQVLSICFRLYSQNRGSPKVVSTAAATIRQAVALLFDHTVAEQPLSPGRPPLPEGLAPGREMAAMLLLQDLMNMCAGHTPTWLKCPMIGRAFVLDLIEFVLLHRPAAFQTHSSFKVLLQSKLAPCIAGLSQTALDPEVEPAATGEAKLLLRCLGALLRKHALLLPEMSLAIIELLLAGCSSSRMPWQRLLSLQVLRSLMADQQLLYVLFTSYDMSIHHDMNAVHDTLSVAVEAIKGYMKAAESSEEDMVAALSGIYSNRAVGKELQMDVDTHGPTQASMQEVWTAYLAIEVLLAVVTSVEVLTDSVSASSAAAPSDPLLLAPLATASTGSVPSALSSSNSLAGLVRGSSTQGTGTPRVSSVNTLFAMQNRSTPASSPRGSTTSLAGLAEDGSKASTAVGGSSTVVTAQAGLSTLGSAAAKPHARAALSMALSAPVVAAQHVGVAPLSEATVSTVVDVLWRPVLAGLSSVLAHCRSRSSHESLMLVLLRGFQSYIFSAGALGEMPARNDFLKVLCEAAVTPATAEEPAGSGSGDNQAVSRLSNSSGAVLDADLALSVGPAPGPGPGAGLNTPGAALGGTQTSLTLPGIGLKNVHCLRTVFNVAHRLADSLGNSWGLVVEVLYSLDKALPAVGSGSGGKMDDAGFEPGTLTGELLILATAANQLFQSTQYMSPDAQASLMSALSQVSSWALTAAQAQGSAFTLAAAVSAGGQGPSAGLSSSTAAGQVKLPALNRMVEVLLFNLPRIQNLWPIFLTHLMEVLHSGNSVVRAAGLEALDRCLTGAIAARDLGLASTGPQQQPALSFFPTFQEQQQQEQQRQQVAGSGSGQSSEGHAADVEHMLLVALEGMYKEEREPDVRLGLLRVALHLLQRHGEALSRGWVPLLRLLEAVPSWEDATTISASYQCVESVCSDFLPTMPKMYIAKALEVVQLFAAQKSAINISLSAVGLLWNATDLLGRSRAAAIAAAAAAVTVPVADAPAQPLQHSSSGVSSALGGIFSVLSLSRRPTVDDAAKAAPAAAGGPPARPTSATSPPPASSSSSNIARAGSPSGVNSSVVAGPQGDGGAEPASAAAADPHLAGRSDLSEDECTELLIRVFEHLRSIGMDPRPEVRNSGMRTLFLAVGSQAGRFKLATWRHCLWEILFPLITYAHVMGDVSSSEEAAAVELGKEKGKAVMMLVHHSRNTEQKQWDETTVLAFNGLCKVLRAHMTTVLAIPGINDKWDETCKIASQALMSGRKSVAIAAAQLLTGVLQGFKAPSASQGHPSAAPAGAAAAGAAAPAAVGAGAAANYTWKRTLTAIDEGVTVMAMPNTRVPLQARSELLNGLSAAYAAQASEGVFDVQDMQLLLRWLDMLARNPKGADDVKAVTGVLPPVQKLVLQLLGQINMALLPDAWPDMLGTLAGFLCPFRAMMQQRQQEAMAAAAVAAAAAAAGAAPGGGNADMAAPLRTPRAAGQVASSPQAAGPPGPPRSFSRLFSARPGGPVPAAATDAAQLTSQWMGKVVKRLVELYAHAPWQVRATLFGPVVQGLSECAALRYITPEDLLWQQAAAGLTSVVQAGLPAVNIMFVNYTQQPENAWQVLADTFETFLLGEGLPGSLPPAQQQKAGAVSDPQQQQQQQRVLQHSSSNAGSASLCQQLLQSSSTVAEQAAGAAADFAAEAALQKSVLDTLTEHVLTSCSSATHDQRSRLVRVLVVGAGSTKDHACLTHGAAQAAAAAAAGIDSSSTMAASAASAGAADATTFASGSAAEAAAKRSSVGQCVGPDQRFSQMCLRRLALLASRGTDGQAGSLNAVLLEVAQIALPQLLQRCRAVLQAYARVEQEAAARELQQLRQQVEQQQQQGGLISLDIQQQDGIAGEQMLPSVSQAECTVVAVVQQGHQQQQQQEGGESQVVALQLQCLVDEVLCVLHVLFDLHNDVAVFEQMIQQEPSLAACLAAVQHAQAVHAQIQQQQQPAQLGQQAVLVQQQQQQLQLAPAADHTRRNSSQGGVSEQGDGDRSSRHQGHLLLLYKELADCVGCRDRRVGVLVRAALQAIGRQLAL